jgi:hypothetical protein
LTTLPIWPILLLQTKHSTTANRSSRPALQRAGGRCKPASVPAHAAGNLPGPNSPGSCARERGTPSARRLTSLSVPEWSRSVRCQVSGVRCRVSSIECQVRVKPT